MEAAAFDEAALGAEAAASLSDPAKQNALMCKLLGSVYNANGEGHEAIFSVDLLFELTCACSGTAVDVLEPMAQGDVPCCVVICGFAGSSLKVLQGLKDMYASRHPTWRIIVSTIPGLSVPEAAPQIEKQVEKIARTIGSVPRIVGHVMSNMGHHLWVRLLQTLTHVIFDCCLPAVQLKRQDTAKEMRLAAVGPKCAEWWELVAMRGRR